jgi:hypothetical protein
VPSIDPAAEGQDDSLALACNSDPRVNRGLAQTGCYRCGSVTVGKWVAFGLAYIEDISGGKANQDGLICAIFLYPQGK